MRPRNNQGQVLMKTQYAFKLIVPALLFGMVLSAPSFAEDSASQSMNKAGEKMEQAGSDTASAAKDVYHGTARAVKDSTITAEVKTALARDKSVKSTAIHVSTSDGIVTLKGNVPSPDMAERAKELAGQEKGVQRVDNQLMVVSSARTD
jgi:hyperosmotically inducible protein